MRDCIYHVEGFNAWNDFMLGKRSATLPDRALAKLAGSYIRI